MSLLRGRVDVLDALMDPTAIEDLVAVDLRPSTDRNGLPITAALTGAGGGTGAGLGRNVPRRAAVRSQRFTQLLSVSGAEVNPVILTIKTEPDIHVHTVDLSSLLKLCER